MPEKPEVITVCNSLKKKILGKKIIGCNIFWDNIIAYPSTDLFKKEIINQVINNISTRGKFIVFTLDDYNLLVHLRMEGKFMFRKVGDEFSKHEHVELQLDPDISFRFHDVRKFGKMYLFKKDESNDKNPLNELGLEYYDSSLDEEYLYNKLHLRKLPIKTVLLDQSIVCGIGNIYVDEILFMSGINPLRKACDITKKECKLIISNFKIVMKKAVSLGGTTIKSFTSEEGVHGNFQDYLLAHGREVCPNCSNKIVKTKVGGRGTYYCSKCQK